MGHSYVVILYNLFSHWIYPKRKVLYLDVRLWSCRTALVGSLPPLLGAQRFHEIFLGDHLHPFHLALNLSHKMWKSSLTGKKMKRAVLSINQTPNVVVKCAGRLHFPLTRNYLWDARLRRRVTETVVMGTLSDVGWVLTFFAQRNFGWRNESVISW